MRPIKANNHKSFKLYTGLLNATKVLAPCEIATLMKQKGETA